MTTQDEFLKDVATHALEIIQDNGVYRHLRFSKPGSRGMQFDLLTWPGHLCYTGDMGTYVFQRLQDMLEFFRTDREYNKNKGRKLGINRGYWAQKLEAVDVSGSTKGSATEYSQKLMEDVIKRQRLEWIRERAIDKEQRKALWEDLDDLLADLEGNSDVDYRLVNDWSWKPAGCDERHGYYFEDLWDHNFSDYTFHFTWCCYALAWGIELYDKTKEQMK